MLKILRNGIQVKQCLLYLAHYERSVVFGPVYCRMYPSLQALCGLPLLIFPYYL